MNRSYFSEDYYYDAISFYGAFKKWPTQAFIDL